LVNGTAVAVIIVIAEEEVHRPIGKDQLQLQAASMTVAMVVVSLLNLQLGRKTVGLVVKRRLPETRLHPLLLEDANLLNLLLGVEGTKVPPIITVDWKVVGRGAMAVMRQLEQEEARNGVAHHLPQQQRLTKRMGLMEQSAHLSDPEPPCWSPVKKCRRRQIAPHAATMAGEVGAIEVDDDFGIAWH
jgi:hypothetical protein